MFKKILLSITVLITLITGYLLYFTFGRPLLFLDSFKWAVSSRHRRIEKVDSIAWIKFNDISKVRAIYPDLGEPLDDRGYLLVVEGKYETWGGYNDGKAPIVSEKHTGTVYNLRGANSNLTFSMPQKPNYKRLANVGSLRRLQLPWGAAQHRLTTLETAPLRSAQLCQGHRLSRFLRQGEGGWSGKNRASTVGSQSSFPADTLGEMALSERFL